MKLSDKRAQESIRARHLRSPYPTAMDRLPTDALEIILEMLGLFCSDPSHHPLRMSTPGALKIGSNIVLAPLQFLKPPEIHTKRDSKIVVAPRPKSIASRWDVMRHPIVQLFLANHHPGAYEVADCEQLMRLWPVRQSVRSIEMHPASFCGFHETRFDADWFGYFPQLTHLELVRVKHPVDVSVLADCAPRLQQLRLTRVTTTHICSSLRKLTELSVITLEEIDQVDSFGIVVGLSKLQSLTILAGATVLQLDDVASLASVAPLETLIVDSKWSGTLEAREHALRVQLKSLNTFWSLGFNQAWRLEWLLAQGKELEDVRVDAVQSDDDRWLAAAARTKKSLPLTLPSFPHRLVELSLGYSHALRDLSPLTCLASLQVLQVVVHTDPTSDCRPLRWLANLQSLTITNGRVWHFVSSLRRLHTLHCVDEMDASRAFADTCGENGDGDHDEKDQEGDDDSSLPQLKLVLPVRRLVLQGLVVLLPSDCESRLQNVEQVEVRHHHHPDEALKSVAGLAQIKRLSISESPLSSTAFADLPRPLACVKRLEELFVCPPARSVDQDHPLAAVVLPEWFRKASKMRALGLPTVDLFEIVSELLPSLEYLHMPFYFHGDSYHFPWRFEMTKMKRLHMLSMAPKARGEGTLWGHDSLPPPTRYECVVHGNPECWQYQKKCDMTGHHFMDYRTVLVPRWACGYADLPVPTK